MPIANRVEDTKKPRRANTLDVLPQHNDNLRKYGILNIFSSFLFLQLFYANWITDSRYTPPHSALPRNNLFTRWKLVLVWIQVGHFYVSRFARVFYLFLCHREWGIHCSVYRTGNWIDVRKWCCSRFVEFHSTISIFYLTMLCGGNIVLYARGLRFGLERVLNFTGDHTPTVWTVVGVLRAYFVALRF